MTQQVRQPQQRQEETSLQHQAPAPVDRISRIAIHRLMRQLNVLRILILVLTVISGLSVLQSIAQVLLYKFSFSSFIFLSVGLVAFVGFGYLYYTLRGGKVALSADLSVSVITRWQHRLTLSAIAVIGFALVAQAIIQLTLAYDASLTAWFLLLPVLAPVLGLNRQYVVRLSILIGVVLIVTYTIFDLTNDALIGSGGDSLFIRLTTWVLCYCAIAGCTIASTSTLATAFQQEETQTSLVTELLGQRENANRFGANLSHGLASIVVELEGAASQQASGSQQQVATITETTSSLEELGETASQIAANSKNVLSAIAQLVEIAQRVQDGSEQAQVFVQNGTTATEQTNESVRQARNRIELLGQRLLAVTAQMRKVSETLSFIRNIADETHLLALNASIEAAGEIWVGVGVGEGEENIRGINNRQRRGERFNTIAIEVKNLSDSTQEFLEETSQVISEMQGVVAAAVLVAEESKKSMTTATERSTVAGNVIHHLSASVNDGASQFGLVLEIAERVRTQSEEISIATSQQKTAINQVVTSMREVAEVSRQSAGAVSQIAQTVKGVNTQIIELNDVLKME